MHWLETLDAALLRFINQTLSNPFFDWLMPVLSGNRAFIPVVAVAVMALLWKGGARARIAVLILVPTLLLGDHLICNTIKHLVARPRPFFDLPGLHVLVGKTDSGSLPSAHAANWAAATMILFIYYRRSLWFMLPLAVGVSFSRVYNGVHYPSDVLAGAILGAGYGACVVWTVDALWRWAGRRWFPLWWKHLSSLLNPDSREPRVEGREPEPIALDSRPSTLDQHWLRLGYLLIAALLLFRLAYIASGTIELENDEAYQWLWSKHPALSYFSKPPLIAYAQFLGTSLWGDNAFGVRFFSPVVSAILSLALLRFFAREASARLGVVLLLIATATPMLAAGAILLTVDPLNVLFWTAAMLAGWRAAQPDGATRHWLWVGLWMGLGFLSKYTALFQLLSWALFFLLWPPARPHLRKPGPWLALLVNALCAVPVLIWNAQHGWVTVSHVADRGEFNEPFRLTLRFVFDFLGSEAALLNPFFFLGMVWAAIAFWRSERRDARLLYCFSMGAPVFVVFFLQSFHARVLPNWIAPGVLPLLCLTAFYWDKRRDRAIVRWGLKAGLILGLTVVGLLHQTDLVKKATGHYLPVRYDPLHRVRGWHEVARIAGDARRKLEAESGKPTFIICTHYTYVSQITFYLPEAKAAVRGVPLVYYQETDKPENQFFFLPNYRYSSRKGDNAIYLDELERPQKESDPPPQPKPTPPELLKQFASVKSLGVFNAGYKGRPIWWFQMWECREQR